MRQRILVHDYSGHPFQAQLSRRLAARGHEVVHAYSQSVLSPRGALALRPGDPRTLRFEGLRLAAPVDRQAYVRRFLQERAYARLLAECVRATRPDVVLSGNTPLEAQRAALRAARASGARFVFWLQDVHGLAIESLLGARLGALGRLVGRHYRGIEQRLLRASDAVVAISEDFSGTLAEWGVPRERVRVIPNWASLEELPPRPKENAWAQAHGLAARFCFLYSGTLGMKHNPELLLQLALAYRDRPEVCVAVVSEGAGADWLRQRKAELGLEGLRLFPFQPYERLPDVMGSANVLVAILEPQAGVFSVPSKVLSYFCAGRALLLSVPAENQAARVVVQAGAGTVVDPRDAQAFITAAEALRMLPLQRRRMALNALRYARETFDADRIAERFEQVLAPRAAPQPLEEEIAHEPA